MLLSSSDTKPTLIHLFLFTNSAQSELVSICTQSIRNCNLLSLHYNLAWGNVSSYTQFEPDSPAFFLMLLDIIKQTWQTSKVYIIARFTRLNKNQKLLDTNFCNFKHSLNFLWVMWGPTQNLGRIGSAVMTFIGY